MSGARLAHVEPQVVEDQGAEVDRAGALQRDDRVRVAEVEVVDDHAADAGAPERELSTAVPTLEALGFSATVFVVAGMLGEENTWEHRGGPGYDRDFLTPTVFVRSRSGE